MSADSDRARAMLPGILAHSEDSDDLEREGSGPEPERLDAKAEAEALVAALAARGFGIAMRLTERQREGMRRVLWKLSSATGARWDQHLRGEVGDSNADKVIAWVHAELNALPEGKEHHDRCNANPKNAWEGHDGLCSMMCAGGYSEPLDLGKWL